MRIGILGYGNLGRGIECAIKQNKDMELAAVFTRRNPADVKILTEGVNIYSVDNILEHKDEIDVLILCGGSATDLPVQTFLSGTQGGDQQIGARIAYNEIDAVLFFSDPLTKQPNEPEISTILRLCDVHNIPLATNLASAEMLILGIQRGDLDWRYILNPSK